jgi:uncharacterized membrane protein YhaH (DUF805 family)
MSPLLSTAAGVGRQLIDPRGRCNRQGFLALAIVLLALQTVGGTVLVLAGAPLDGGLALALNAPLFWIGFMAVLKRLHDIGRSGWWVPVAITGWFIGCVVISAIAGVVVGPDRLALAVEERTLVFWIVFAATTIPAFGGLLWLHASPGEMVANRYGAVPGVLGFSLPTAVETLPEAAATTA